jgi:hypothetical protein
MIDCGCSDLAGVSENGFKFEVKSFFELGFPTKCYVAPRRAILFRSSRRSEDSQYLDASEPQYRRFLPRRALRGNEPELCSTRNAHALHARSSRVLR